MRRYIIRAAAFATCCLASSRLASRTSAVSTLSHGNPLAVLYPLIQNTALTVVAVNRSLTVNLGVLGMFRRLLQFARDRAGAALLEFTVVLPVLLFVMMGAMQFGSVVYNLNVVANATAAGIRQLSISRGEVVVANPASGPYTDTAAQIDGYFSASDLKNKYVTITLVVNGTTCTTDTSCQTALTTAQLQKASVTVQYTAPCIMQYIFNSCNLTSKLYSMVQ